MNRIINWRTKLAAVAVCFSLCRFAVGEHAIDTGHSSAPTELRGGGVLEESFAYHPQPPPVHQAHATSARDGGWYGYGFPVKSYRWGWFGVNYYPTVNWYHGYYGDCCRRTYRRGY
jgi:hypothetical protein